MRNSSPVNNNNNEQRNTRFRAYFKRGFKFYYISSNSLGYSTADHYSMPAVDLNGFLKESSELFDGVNGRIGFASWANSEKEFVFILNHLFNLYFFTTEEYERITNV